MTSKKIHIFVYFFREYKNFGFWLLKPLKGLARSDVGYEAGETPILFDQNTVFPI